MSFRGKRELLVQVAHRYSSARHGQRAVILDDDLTGFCHRRGLLDADGTFPGAAPTVPHDVVASGKGSGSASKAHRYPIPRWQKDRFGIRRHSNALTLSL